LFQQRKANKQTGLLMLKQKNREETGYTNFQYGIMSGIVVIALLPAIIGGGNWVYNKFITPDKGGQLKEENLNHLPVTKENHKTILDEATVQQ